jgi:hypothetical protein
MSNDDKPILATADMMQPTPGDRPNISIMHSTAKGAVIIDFGNPVAWIGLPPKEARELARVIANNAELLEAKMAVEAKNLAPKIIMP